MIHASLACPFYQQGQHLQICRKNMLIKNTWWSGHHKNRVRGTGEEIITATRLWFLQLLVQGFSIPLGFSKNICIRILETCRENTTDQMA